MKKRFFLFREKELELRVAATGAVDPEKQVQLSVNQSFGSLRMIEC